MVPSIFLTRILSLMHVVCNVFFPQTIFGKGRQIHERDTNYYRAWAVEQCQHKSKKVVDLYIIICALTQSCIQNYSVH